MSLPSLSQFIKDELLVFTITSNGYKHLTHNLWQSLQNINVPWQLAILCLDEPSHTYFNEKGVPSALFKMPNAFYHSGPAVFGSNPFKKLVAMKLEALRLIVGLSAIKQLIYIDGDIVVFNDFVPTVRDRLATCDLWFQCDSGIKEPCAEPCAMPCTGFICLNLTDETRPKFNELFVRNPGTWLMSETDQDYVQGRLKKLGINYKTLDRLQFPNGIFLRDKELPAEAQLVHFNFLVGTQKEAKMRSLDLWYI